MKGYKIYEQLKLGEESKLTKYSANYNKAVQEFNDFLRKAIDDNLFEIVSKNDFGREVLSFRKSLKLYNKDNIEIICRKCPFIIYRYKDTNKLIANLYYWKMIGNKYEDYDIDAQSVVLEEINILE